MGDDVSAYSLQITEEGLQSLNTTFLEAVKLVCETIVTVAQASEHRSIERQRIDSEGSIAVAKINAKGAAALVKAEGRSKLACLQAEAETAIALHTAGVEKKVRY